MAQPALPSPPESPAPDGIVTLDDVTWEDYRRILAIRGDRSVPRMAYLEGRLELMNPSKTHEGIRGMIGRLLEAWCIDRGIDVTPLGSWTLENKAAARAVEPDECYVLGDNPEAQRPELAIEVIWTSGGIGKLEIYRKLDVREVWIWKKGTLVPYALREEKFEAITRSELFPELDLELLNRFVHVHPMTRAVREYRAALREAAG